MPETLEDRFWAKVRKSDDCWEWTASKKPSGYGQIRQRVNGSWTSSYAHRVSYELANGPIPDGLLVCHRCDNPECVRPIHLFLGTNADNLQDMASKGRHFLTGRPKCRTGQHERTPDNIYVNGKGVHQCRACMRDKQRRYRAKRKQPVA